MLGRDVTQALGAVANVRPPSNIMTDETLIRINDLCRELKIKAKVLIDYLPQVGLTEKKTHSSSIDLATAEKVRKHFGELVRAGVPLNPSLPQSEVEKHLFLDGEYPSRRTFP